MAKITVIPATKDLRTKLPLYTKAKRKVAGYARVSTDSDEQFTSYKAQIDYYTNYIKSRDDWEFVGVYSDEGISGLNTKKRDGFNTMIEDALAGRIDLIVTKSVSRFARNTVDSLVIIRKLKDAGVECFFEKENIYTFDGKGELLLTIMSSLAQEESRSISENVTWGQRKRFADGKYSVAYKHFLGYDRGPDGKLVINKEQAELVRRIYDLFMSGKTAHAIAKELTAEGIPTPAGKKNWQTSTVNSILTNEKYKGDALLQKTITVDFLQRKMKSNEGEVPQYYVHDSHPAIISPRLFDEVQMEIERRKKYGKSYSGKSIFSCKIICGDCGSFYGAKLWHSTDDYSRTVWQCNGKYKGEKKCTTPHLTEDEIKRGFLEAFNRLWTGKTSLIEDCLLIQQGLTDCTAIDAQIKAAEEELDVVGEMIRKHVETNAMQAQDQDEYTRKYESLTARIEEARAKSDRARKQRTARLAKADAIGGFIFMLKERDSELTYFDAHLWVEAIDTVTVFHDGKLLFRFQSGVEVTV